MPGGVHVEPVYIVFLLVAIVLALFAGYVFGKSGKTAMATRNELLGRQLEEAKDEANKQLGEAKDEANRQIETLKTEAAKQLSEAKTEAENRLSEAKTEAEKRLNAQIELSAKQLSSAKAEAERQLSNAKAEAAKQLKEAKDEAERRLNSQLTQQETRHKQDIETQREFFNQSTEALEDKVTKATEELLKQRGQELNEKNKTQLDSILGPLNESIENMRKAMTDATQAQSEMGGQMKANAEAMMRQAEATRKSADELSQALRGRGKVQGDWGETVLSELLEANGLTEGIHFDTQPTLRNADGTVIKTKDGRQLRPDVILHLDNRREVIIDSKVSITAYVDYVNATEDSKREQALKDHIRSIEQHVDELSKKDYSSYIKPPKATVDFVIMFVPHIGAWITALNEKPELWRRAMEKNVYIADEQNLFSVLKIVNLSWKQITQAERQNEVYKLAERMIERVGEFYKHYKELGDALKKATQKYDEGEGKLKKDGPSIIKTCNDLTELGAKVDKKNSIYPLLTKGEE